MAEQDKTYQTKVGEDQGGALVFVREDGYMKFFDTDFTGIQLRNFIRTQFTTAIIMNSAGVASAVPGDSSPPILPSGIGYIFLSFADAASNASMRLCSGKVGEEMRFFNRGGGSAWSILVFASGAAGSGIAGVSLMGRYSGALSSIRFNASAAGSQVYLQLKCVVEGTWEIVDYSPLTVIPRTAS